MSLYDVYRFATSTPIIIILFFVLMFSCVNIKIFLGAKKEEETESLVLPLLKNLKYEKVLHIFAIFLYVLCSVLLIFNSTQILYMLGCEDMRIMPEGTYCRKVYITSESDKTYLLPAKIYKHEGEYCVDRVYFSNGGYLTFGDEYAEFDETVNSFDRQERYWTIRLTNQKAYHSDVQEEYSFDVWHLIANVVMSVIILFSAFLETAVFIKNLKKQKTFGNPPTEKDF